MYIRDLRFMPGHFSIDACETDRMAEASVEVRAQSELLELLLSLSEPMTSLSESLSLAGSGANAEWVQNDPESAPTAARNGHILFILGAELQEHPSLAAWACLCPCMKRKLIILVKVKG